MKKHLDWKRIGWTAKLILFFASIVCMALAVTNLISELYLGGAFIKSQLLGRFVFISLFYFLAYVFEKAIIIHYHNGEEEPHDN